MIENNLFERHTLKVFSYTDDILYPVGINIHVKHINLLIVIYLYSLVTINMIDL